MLLSSSKKKPAIGLTPLIDVVFILLIFFMLVMQFQHFQQNPVSLKKSASQSIKVNQATKVLANGNGQCVVQAQLLDCNEFINTLAQNASSTPSVLLGYSDDITLQQLMHLHDTFIQNNIDASLAIKASSALTLNRSVEMGRSE